MRESELQKSLYRGQNRWIVDTYWESGKRKLRVSEIPCVIGALSNLGLLEEAERLFHENERRFSSLQRAESSFFLGLGFCRHSFYERAKEYFFKNVLLLRNTSHPKIRFFAYHGSALHHYFGTRFHRASKLAEKAFAQAQRADFLFGKYSSSDLKGFALVESGRVLEGIQDIERGAKFAKRLGSGGVVQAAEIAMECYRAQFGLTPLTSLARLETLYSKTQSENTYSKSSLLLEMGRQLTLRGQISKSNEKLFEACKLIYSSRHKRHGAFLNLRLAENQFLKGRYQEALSLVRSCVSEIDPKRDLTLMLAVKGFEEKLCKKLNLPSPSSEVAELTRTLRSGLGTRILNRQNLIFEKSVGDDPLGDLLDEFANPSEETLDRILERGYLGLLPRYFQLPPETRGFFLDLIPGKVLLVDAGEVVLFNESFSRQTRDVLRELQKGPQSKATLIKNVWGYDYNPIRHDNLVYSALARLRQALGTRGHWIENTNDGYRLAQEIQVSFRLDKKIQPVPAAAQPSVSLSARQLRILELLETETFIDVGTLCRKFRVSKLTASRDLTKLNRLGLIIRTGSARATRYCSPDCKFLSSLLGSMRGERKQCVSLES